MRNLQWIKQLTSLPVWEKYSPTEWVIFSVGAIFIFFLLINMFTSLGERTSPPHTKETPSLDEMENFEKTLSSMVNSSIEDATNIKILENGSGFVPDLLAEIKNAKETINITNYIWEDDNFGNMLFESLIEKQKEGIQVRVLLDGIGGRKANKELIEELEKSGGQVAHFRPVRWYNISRINKRTHIRDIVIDGRIAYFGGIAFSDLWLGDGNTPKSWHDFMFKMDGATAVRADSIFANLWSQTTGEILPTSKVEVRPTQEPKSSSHFISLFSTPSPDMSHDMEHFIWLSIMSAQNNIYIENPYILPSDSILEALKIKAKEGVEIKIIVPSEKIDAKHVRWASQSFYGELLDAGIKILEYQPSRTHAKIITIDDKWSIIGSANLDNRSRKINLELIIGISNNNFAKDLRAQFEEDIKNSKEIAKEEWAKKSIFARPFQLISRIFIEQY